MIDVEKKNMGKPQIKVLHKRMHTCRGDFLKHILHDKNLSVSKYLHVKTATRYAECVKKLDEGRRSPD